jgi:maleate isomerase
MISHRIGLGLVVAAEVEFGLPVLSAATAGACSLLTSLGLLVDIPGAGRLLRLGAAQPA